MKQLKHIIIGFCILPIIASTWHACTSDQASVPDVNLVDEIFGGGFTYYINSDTIIPAEGNSPHGDFRLRFNSIATSALDSTGELPVGDSFPNGSLLVKELIASSGSIIVLVTMKKNSQSPFANEGWLWSEFGAEGEVLYSFTEGGDGCVACHSQQPNRDLTRTFDLH